MMKFFMTPWIFYSRDPFEIHYSLFDIGYSILGANKKRGRMAAVPF